MATETQPAISEQSKTKDTLRAEVQSVGRHSLIYMIGPAFSKIVGFLLIPIYTRYITPDEYGVMSLVDQITALVVMVLSLNVSDAMTRFYYRTRNESERQQLVSTVIVGFGLLAIPILLLCVAFSRQIIAPIVDAQQYTRYMQLAMVVAWFTMLLDIGYNYLRMCYRSKTFVTVTITQILASVTLNIWLVVGLGLGIWGILYSTLLVQGSLALVVSAAILVQNRAWPSLADFQKLIRYGLPLVPANVSQQLNNYLTPFMIRWLASADPVVALAQVGLFSAGQKMGVVVNRFLVVPFNSFWRPRRMELVTQNDKQVDHIIAQMCTYSTIVNLAFAVLLSVAIQPMLQLIIDPQYLNCHYVVPIITLAYVVHGLEHHFATGIHHTGKTYYASVIGVVCLAMVVVLNFGIIPQFGIMGAATVSLMAAVVRSSLFYCYSQKIHYLPFEKGRLGVLFVLAAVVFALAQLVQFDSAILNLILRTAVGMLFAPLLFWVGFFRSSEIAGMHEQWIKLLDRFTNQRNNRSPA